MKTKEELIDHLTRLVAAYRRSYKLCGIINTTLQIVSGIIGCTAVLALVPAIPVFIAVVGAVPPVVAVLASKTRIAEKKTLLKTHHRSFKQLLSYVQATAGLENDEEVIRITFNKILEIQKNDNFTEPLEMYMKRFKLNGH